jgi:cell division protein FtsB
MKNLISRRSILRQNFLTIIGMCLCCYFSYHLLMGDRSYIRLMYLEGQISEAEQKLGVLHAERLAIEENVVRMRPDSLDRDLLEERARIVLGYMRPDEKSVIMTR